MNLGDPLESLLDPNLSRVLYRLAVLPEGTSGRRIHELTGNRTLKTTLGHLNALAALGLVTIQHAGRANLYRLNRHHILWGPIEELFSTPARIEQRLAEQFVELAPGNTLAVFGSFGRREATRDSDIDILIVWDDPPAEAGRAEIIETLIADTELSTGNPVQVIDLTPDHLARMAADRDPLTTSWLQEARTLTPTQSVSDRIKAARA